MDMPLCPTERNSPAVLVMHSASGSPTGKRAIARKFAELGYVAICTDMYGAQLEGVSIEDSGRACLRRTSLTREATREGHRLVRQSRPDPMSMPNASRQLASATGVRPCSNLR